MQIQTKAEICFSNVNWIWVTKADLLTVASDCVIFQRDDACLEIVTWSEIWSGSDFGTWIWSDSCSYERKSNICSTTSKGWGGGGNCLDVKAGFFLGYLERERDLDGDLEREDLEDLELERDVDRPRLRDRLREGFARVLPKTHYMKYYQRGNNGNHFCLVASEFQCYFSINSTL